MFDRAPEENALRRAMDACLPGLENKPGFDREVLMRAKGEMKMKKKFKFGLALTILVALLSMTALAVGASYVLEYRFGKTPPEDFDGVIQEINITHEGAGVKTFVKDAMWDGEQISVGIGFETETPVLIVMDSILADGVPFEVDNSSIEDRWVATNPFAQPGSEPHIHGFVFTLPEGARGQIEVSLSLTLLRPKGDLCPIDTYMEDTRAMWREIDGAVARGETPVDRDEPYPVLVESRWFGDDFSEDMSAQYPLGSASSFVEYSNMEIIDTMHVTFTLDAE